MSGRNAVARQVAVPRFRPRDYAFSWRSAATEGDSGACKGSPRRRSLTRLRQYGLIAVSRTGCVGRRADHRRLAAVLFLSRQIAGGGVSEIWASGCPALFTDPMKVALESPWAVKAFP